MGFEAVVMAVGGLLVLGVIVFICIDPSVTSGRRGRGGGGDGGSGCGSDAGSSCGSSCGSGCGGGD